MRRVSRVRVWTERGLMTIGVALLSWYAIVAVQADQFQRAQKVALDRALATPKATVATTIEPPSLGSVIGSLEIPRLRMSTIVVQGDDDRYLKKGVGHLPDTPFPWEKGTAAFAAHRDTYFRKLNDISAGDRIRLKTTRGDFEYRVREIAIVTPENLSGLSPTDESSLTLITCYPFNFVGHAPKRFVVRAARVEQGRQPAPARSALRSK